MGAFARLRMDACGIEPAGRPVGRRPHLHGARLVPSVVVLAQDRFSIVVITLLGIGFLLSLLSGAVAFMCHRNRVFLFLVRGRGSPRSRPERPRGSPPEPAPPPPPST